MAFKDARPVPERLKLRVETRDFRVRELNTSGHHYDYN